MDSELIYSVENLSFSYPGTNRVVLNDCCFTLRRGEIFSILGPNGAGKSTLLDCLCGLLVPKHGSIRLCGEDIRTLSRRQIAQRASYVQQKYNTAFSYTVIDFVTMGRACATRLFGAPGKKDREKAYEALDALGLTNLAMKEFIQLSGGEQQQVCIARAIVQNPMVILFDEPTAHLDYGRQITALRLLRKMTRQGYAIIMTTHNPEHVILLGGTVGILDKNGILRAGPATEIIAEEQLRTLYETDLYLLRINELSRQACLPPNL